MSGVDDTSCDIVLMGASGFIGSKMLAAIKDSCAVTVVPRELRLHQRCELHDFLSENKPRLGVVCCAGTRGQPNIDWCDEHPVESIDANIIGQLNVATICSALGLHCALIGTGFVYAGSDGKQYSESDPPDNELPKTYIKLRIQLEQLLKYFPNVLNLRVIYPVTRDLTDKRGLIGKLASFSSVDDASGSCTFLEDLCPLVPTLMRKKVGGNLNFTNPGVVSYRKIVEHLKRRDPSYSPEIRHQSGRPVVQLDCSKMLSLCLSEGMKVPCVDESLENIFASEPS